ncbi:MAG TPA: methyltransferase domain-containing protein [Actinomycetota bacterium]
MSEAGGPVCPCGSRWYRTILTSDRYCVYGSNVAEHTYSLRRCVACGLVRTWPPPAEHEHGPFRDDAFIQSYLERAELFEALLAPTVDHVAGLAPPPARLIDVGANVGMIVRMAGERGYEATGIELNEAAVDYARARGLDLRAVRLEDAGFEPESVDVIVLSATAEHLPDLDDTFALCRGLLRRGGVLYVSNSPNLRSAGAKIERDLWYGIQPAGHMWQFTPRTLRAALERAGFVVIAERTYNLHRDFGRNRKQRLKRAVLALAERAGLGDALSMAGRRP